MIIKSNKTITEKQGYEAMLHMLKAFVDDTGSNKITDILNGGEYFISDDSPADDTFWQRWQDAVANVEKFGMHAR